MKVFLTRKLDELVKEKEGIEKVIRKQEADLDDKDIDDSKKQRVNYF